MSGGCVLYMVLHYMYIQTRVKNRAGRWICMFVRVPTQRYMELNECIFFYL